jgi:dTDP-4-dehydrorhamnose 3,5-epimerase
MQISSLAIPDVKLIKPIYHRDERGFFCETYKQSELEAADIRTTFVQDNQSLSRSRGVVRGLHLQTNPRAQGKLIRVIRGAIFDVAVDIRHGSPTFGRHVAAELSATDGTQIWVPIGFAHGFCTLAPDTEIIYKVTDYYAPECDRSIQWNDPALAIAWPVTREHAILSAKDADAEPLAAHPVYFTY